MDREPVYSTHRPVQLATPERKETKGRGRHKRSLSESRESERERGKVKEEREGRKEREGGRRLGHEEGRLTDIAALCYLLTHTHTHVDVGRRTHSARLCTAQLLLFFFPILSPESRPPSFSSPLSERTRETERGGRGGGKRTRRRRRRRGGNNPLLSRHTAERDKERRVKKRERDSSFLFYFAVSCGPSASERLTGTAHVRELGEILVPRKVTPPSPLVSLSFHPHMSVSFSLSAILKSSSPHQPLLSTSVLCVSYLSVSVSVPVAGFLLLSGSQRGKKKTH